MSVSQVIENGGSVVFDQKGSYIEGGGQRIAIAREGNLFELTMWVPREQGQTGSQLSSSFHGQA